MEAILLISIIFGVSIQNVVRKIFTDKVANGAYTFTAGSVLFALVVFVITGIGKFSFTPSVIWYSIAFSVAYSLASVGAFLAISTGSLSLTSLITQYSLIIPTFYGLFVLDEKIGPPLVIGLVLLCISLVFVNIEGKTEKKITLKWMIFALIAFVGNGMCSTIQKAQQIRFDGMYKNEFMIIALAIAVLTPAVFAIVLERKQIVASLKKGFPLYAVCGIANGLVNLFVLILSGKMSASVMFPVISAGGIVLTALISIFVYKEKLSLQQKIGFVLGTAAIVLLNI